MTTAAQSEAKTDLIGWNTKEDWLSLYKKSKKGLLLAKVWASQRRKVHNSLSCSWTPRYCFFYRGAGRWWRWQLGELVTGFRSQVVFTETSEQRRACQAAQYLPCNMMPYCSIQAFSRTQATADGRRETFTKDSHPNVQHIYTCISLYIYWCRFLFWWHTFPF